MPRLLRFGLVSLGIAIVSLWLAVSSLAIAEPSFKMQIVAPECTLDTIDDGLGSVQVITCPPGTIDPEPEPVDVPDANGGGEQTANLQVSKRFNSYTDTLALLDILGNSGMAIELPDGSNLLRYADSLSSSDEASFSLLQTSLASLVVLVVSMIIVFGAFSTMAITNAFMLHRKTTPGGLSKTTKNKLKK